MIKRHVVLGSSSRYRAELLRRVVKVFEQVAAAVDENALPGESAVAQVERLSRIKARAVAELRPDGLIVASDQLAETAKGERIGKPGSAGGAVAQLQQLSGREVRFLTGVCVFDARTAVEQYQLVETEVKMRALSTEVITEYVARDRPLDCAGSFKVEGLGIALIDWVRSDDPTALVGLPLIATLRMLRAAGFEALGPS